jgi:hypothetical protein
MCIWHVAIAQLIVTCEQHFTMPVIESLRCEAVSDYTDNVLNDTIIDAHACQLPE